MPKNIVRKKRKTSKKVTKVGKRGPGRPPKKRGPGRPVKKKTVRRVAAKPAQIDLPITKNADLDFWSNMVGFLNKNKGKSYVVVLDGKNVSLGTR